MTEEEWVRDHADKNSAGCFNVAIAALRERLEKSRVVIGDCTLYCEDAAFIVPTLARVDALVTDPPYGIGADEAASKNEGKWGWKYYGESAWDRKRPPAEIFRLMLAKSDQQIIWGGNYFTDYLRPTMRWLVWDKGQRDFSLADVEMAWCSQDKAARIFTYHRSKALQDGKEHPTQKPIALMKWCIGFVPNARTILDPFMGSGTTGVAAIQMGKKFIGIERERKYFDIACRRIEDAYKQPDMFVAPPEPKPEQMVLGE
jgi:DNA modification methylase